MTLLACVITSCQDNDYDRQEMAVAALDATSINGQLQGDDYVWSWPQQASGLSMNVTVYRNGTLSSSETVSGTSYAHKNIPTNESYEYVFKLTDGKNFSKGVVKSYTREGATSITGIQMRQVDKAGGYDAVVE